MRRVASGFCARVVAGDGEEQSGLEEGSHAVGILAGGDDLWQGRLICPIPGYLDLRS